jgi:polyisoprenoid-binding protein YceI
LRSHIALRIRCRWLLLIALAACAAAPAPARAQQLVIELDPAKTQVQFTLDAFLHTVHGTFKLKQGRIEIDPATGQAGGRLVIDATSGNTDNDGRDNKMHKDVLESGKYPEITFAPTHVQGPIAPQGKSQVQLQGIIGLHGREQNITVQVGVQIAGNEWSGETNFPVPYVKWGLKNPSTLFLRVKDTVDLTVRAAGRLPQP